MNEAIVSPDTMRNERLPPGQALTRKWPVLHAGPTPSFDRAAWDFHIFGLVRQQTTFAFEEFISLPRAKVLADMHCVTRWSKLDNLWEGVPSKELLNHVEPLPEARFVMVHCEYGFTTNLPASDFFAEDCLFAMRHNGVDLEPDHGFPVRLVVPRLYAWKSAKWVRGIEFMAEDQAGFWESWDHGGYHMRGDPWAQERFRPNSDRG